MIGLLLIPLLFTSFTEKWYLPQGTQYLAGRMCIGDTDHDGHDELLFTTYGTPSFSIFIYELHLPNTWEVDSFSGAWDWVPVLWDIGDFDCDGFCDVALHTGIDNPPKNMISIVEAPDSFSYPAQEVWRDTVGPSQVLPITAYDIDRDGVPEIVKNRVRPYGYLGIYESVGDNQYALIFADDPDTTGYTAPCATHAFGDFDDDGYYDFVCAGGYSYWIYESIENNVYEKVYENLLWESTDNIKDCCTVPDADQDGKLEFMLKGFSPSTGTIEMFIMEAVGNNIYAIIDSFIFTGGHPYYGGGYSDAGDVDGDSIPEIVLEACQNVYIIKAAENDSFYVWETLPGHNSGSNVRVFDFDYNGLNEILISGNNETRIYEYDGGSVEEYTSRRPVKTSFTCSPNVVENDIHLSFILSQQTHVALDIYNNLGQKVKSVFAGRLTAGYYSQKVDLNALAAGVYFIQLTTPYQTITQKVVKIK